MMKIIKNSGFNDITNFFTQWLILGNFSLLLKPNRSRFFKKFLY